MFLRRFRVWMLPFILTMLFLAVTSAQDKPADTLAQKPATAAPVESYSPSPDLGDVAFDKYLDGAVLLQAWNSADAALLTDLAIHWQRERKCSYGPTAPCHRIAYLKLLCALQHSGGTLNRCSD